MEMEMGMGMGMGGFVCSSSVRGRGRGRSFWLGGVTVSTLSNGSGIFCGAVSLWSSLWDFGAFSCLFSLEQSVSSAIVVPLPVALKSEKSDLGSLEYYI